MRLRGPWIIRGAGLDTSVSSQSGTLGSTLMVSIMLSPYTFFLDVLQRQSASQVWPINRKVPGGLADADAPEYRIRNASTKSAQYDAEWRHINP